MGIETATAALILSGVSAAGAVVSGIQQSKEADRQAKIAQQQSEAEARSEARSNIALEKRQKLSFLKSGVALEGSPLLLLEETRREGGKNVENVLAGGINQAQSLKASGRQALIGGIASGVGTAASGFASFGSTPENFGQARTGKIPKPSRKPLQ